MANINWTEDSLEELLEKSIGDIREMLAHEDADIDFKTFLIENGWIESEDEDDEDYEDEEDDSYDEDEDDDEEEDVELPSDQEELAEEIAEDISNEKYAIESLYGLYSEDFIQRVRQLID